MATLPEAGVTIDDSASSFAGGTGYIVVMSCVAQSADFVPRVMSSTQDILDQYLYSPGADYCAMHFSETRKPVIFIGLPVATAGAVQSVDSSGVTGTCNISVAAASSGIMEQVTGSVTVSTGGGGKVGTDQIVFDLSCDGGQSTQKVRLGNGTSYTIPNFGIVLNFETGGTLNDGDVFLFQTSAPMWGSTAIASARAALVAQLKLARSWLVVGDLPNATFAGYITTETNAYETANERFVLARAQVSDRLPLATKSKLVVKMDGTPSLTFAASGHTITRDTGSFVTDGFAIGKVVAVAGSASNNGTIGALTGVSATVLTFASGVVNEGPVTGVSVSASDGLTFAASGETVTRSGGGNWLNDGFATGQTISIAGTASNNQTSVTLSNVTSTVLTLSGGAANEGPIASAGVTITQVQTFGAWINAQAAAFASVDAQKRIDLGAGRRTKASPVTKWLMRRPAAWAASLREYQHDVHTPCWRKEDGPLDGWGLATLNGSKVEFDERVDGGALAGRFTCFRSYGNGPEGAFIALSLTRDSEGSLLSRTHNMYVANLACTVVQAATENAIGRVLQLNDDGTATEDSLKELEGLINDELQVNLLQQTFPGTPAEGPRASSAVWTASRTDVFNVVGPTMHGTLALEENGTLENIQTVVRVQTAA